MAHIPLDDISEPTVRDIYEFYEQTQESSLRPHLGASLIGKACQREIWYTFRWVKNVLKEGKMVRLLETGKLAETRFVSNLRDIGIEVKETEEDGKQISVKFLNGHFGGSLDAIAKGFKVAPEKWHVVEMKTHNEKSFKKLIEKGVKLAKPEHYIQMQVYMKGRGLERTMYMAVNKNTEELYCERVKFDQNTFDEMLQKAEQIVFSDYAPRKISNDPKSWNFLNSTGCKYCPFNEICHNKEVPLANCRTCLHATVERNGTWSCNKRNVTLDVDDQKRGCSQHLYLPCLIGDVSDAGETYVEYQDGRKNLEGGFLV
jgi:CRISPR/Cas system-associated exonuclease Cas4 (RecB family)